MSKDRSERRRKLAKDRTLRGALHVLLKARLARIFYAAI